MPPSDINWLTAAAARTCLQKKKVPSLVLLHQLNSTQLNSNRHVTLYQHHFNDFIENRPAVLKMPAFSYLPFPNFAQIYDVNKFSKLLLLLLLVMFREVENVCWWCDWFWRQPTATTTTTSKSRPESSLLVSLKALFVIGDLQRLWTTTIEQNQIEWESNLAPFL